MTNRNTICYTKINRNAIVYRIAIYPQIERGSLKRGKKLSFVRRARNGSRARLQRETRAERRAKPSRERERPPLKRQVHKSRGNGFDDRKRELLHCGGCKGFRFRFFLLMKPCGLWQACLAEGGKEIEISVKLRRWCRKKRCSKMRSSHKYIFYFYPTWRKNERGEIEEIKGSFRFFERVKDGKAAAARMGRKYDHQKIF